MLSETEALNLKFNVFDRQQAWLPASGGGLIAHVETELAP